MLSKLQIEYYTVLYTKAYYEIETLFPPEFHKDIKTKYIKFIDNPTV